MHVTTDLSIQRTFYVANIANVEPGHLAEGRDANNKERNERKQVNRIEARLLRRSEVSYLFTTYDYCCKGNLTNKYVIVPTCFRVPFL